MFFPAPESIIWVFLLNNFSRVINLLLIKLARDLPGRISALGLYCTDLATLGLYCQDLGPIFSQYGPRARLIRFMYCVLFLSGVSKVRGVLRKAVAPGGLHNKGEIIFRA